MIRKKNVVLLFAILFFISIIPVFANFERADIYRIDATKNASHHNNLGLELLEEDQYYAAIEEFNIAINLNPNTQATAVYYNNLGETYFKLGLLGPAQSCFEK